MYLPAVPKIICEKKNGGIIEIPAGKYLNVYKYKTYYNTDNTDYKTLKENNGKITCRNKKVIEENRVDCEELGRGRYTDILYSYKRQVSVSLRMLLLKDVHCLKFKF